MFCRHWFKYVNLNMYNKNIIVRDGSASRCNSIYLFELSADFSNVKGILTLIACFVMFKNWLTMEMCLCLSVWLIKNCSLYKNTQVFGWI